MLRFTLFFILCYSHFYAHEKHIPLRLFAPQDRSAFLPQLPKANLLTGEYCEEACDLIVAGIEPLSVRRFYTHFSGPSEQMYGHWRVNPETLMLFNFEGGGHPFVGMGEKNSAFLIYDKQIGGGFAFDCTKQTGLTATSGKNHPLNREVTWIKKEVERCPNRFCEMERHCWWEGVLKEGDGRERKFRTDERYWPQNGDEHPCHRSRHPCSGELQIEYLSFEPPYQGQIFEERTPNGNIIRYEYEDCYKNDPYVDHELPTSYKLRAMRAYSATGLFLGSIEVFYERDKVRFRGSDGREAVHIHAERRLNRFTDKLLNFVNAPGKPEKVYDYINHKNKRGTHYDQPPFLYQVAEKGGNYYETSYDNQRRVEVQYAPLGPKGERVVLARYAYEKGATSVWDAENNKKVYRYNDDKRIVAVETYEGDRLYSVEHSEWEGATGNLVQRRLEDAAGEIFYRVDFRYDKNHNCVEERVDGALPICRTYSDDGFNLLLTESDRPGKVIQHTYLSGTNLLISSLVYLEGKIVKRTFHFYDNALGGVCIKTIVDDGTTLDPNSWSEASFRRVTVITPKRELPCIGYPEEIREYAGDELLSKRRFTYHPSGKVTKEEHYDGEGTYLYAIEYKYDEQERLVAKSDPLGHITTYSYDNQFNLTAQCGPKPGQRKAWVYDSANRPIEEKEWLDEHTFVVTTTKYDRNGRVIARKDPSGFETRYTYDALGRLITTHYPDGGIERRFYNVCGHLLESSDPNGYTTRWEVNVLGQPTALIHPDGSMEQFTYHLPGGTLATHTDVHGAITTYTYDLLDNLIKTEIGNCVTQATYSPFYLLSEIDPLGVKTSISHDLAGRKSGEKKGERECHFIYNKRGELEKTIEGETITHFIYDLKGQLLTKSIPGFFEEHYAYDETGNQIAKTTCTGTTSTHYNGCNNPTRIIDPLGNATEIFYSYENGLTKTLTEPNGVTKITRHDYKERPTEVQTIDDKGEVIHWEKRTYDLAGNQIGAYYPIEEVKLEWRYGPRNRLEGVIQSGVKEWLYLYDDRGRLKSVMKPDHKEIRRSYDNLGRLSRVYGEGIDYSYIYDVKNRLTTISEGKNQTKFAYDIYDNIVSEQLSNGLLIQRTFDPYGRKNALLFPDGTDLSYTYKGPFLHTVSRKGLTLIYAERNLAGRVTQINLPNHDRIQIEWDPLHRWSKYEAPHYKATYTYDRVGNLIQMNDTIYQHDALHQLIAENGHVYTYDTLYNRKSKDGKEYTLNTLSQVTSDELNTYTYDKNGNLLSDGLTTYEYDLLDRLIATTKEGKRTVYVYDPLNRRIVKNDELYLWDGEEEIGKCVCGKFTELRHLGEKRPVFFEFNEELYVPLLDPVGTVMGLLSQDGEICATYRYSAFGECTAPPINWGFSGKRRDSETGFLYFGRRYYSPNLGRWITADPQGFQDGPNPYAYVYNNPLHFEDPFGLFAKSLRETQNPLDFLGYMWYSACRAIEWIGHNLIPIPGVCDAVEAFGRVGRGGGFYKPRADPRVIHIPGLEVPHLDKTYHNGILTSQEGGTEQSEGISEMYGGVAVAWLYNPSHGIVCDLLMCLIAKCGIKTAYERMCARYYASKLERDRHREFHATAHSQGATRLYNTGNMLSVEQCQHITVEAFGPATIIPRGRFKEVDNYISWLDGVPCTSTCSYLKNVVGMDSNATFLTPHTKSPLNEHFLLGDTYGEQLRRNGKDFVQTYFN